MNWTRRCPLSTALQMTNRLFDLRALKVILTNCIFDIFFKSGKAT